MSHTTSEDITYYGVKGANIGVAVVEREGWEDRRHGSLFPLVGRQNRRRRLLAVNLAGCAAVDKEGITPKTPHE